MTRLRHLVCVVPAFALAGFATGGATVYAGVRAAFR